ncbi:uncharacterized protein LOC120259574 isoform X2 [Dioscorea cayenensis subsp. rotundata]|uniref:Uncharacterized protein LOC120259574 isoform X2 n=1 Tax=Dioscorea cayennensis subsp. rotundata TaxID=55577 RepID=A0AB40B7B4_DIOCR|nr:uncharacterized protein LOC120259574 isoform X2 [Dioscorea cayenensis subsp. rotundata]
MASIRSALLVRQFIRASPFVGLAQRSSIRLVQPQVGALRIRCAASNAGDGEKKVSARLALMQQLLQGAEERALSAGSEPTPKITLDHVTVSFARSGGPGGQNVNKVNTKVDMRFNVKNAHWLSERVRERIFQMEKNRINKDGEIVISSTKTRTQKGNIEDALEKLQGCYRRTEENAEQESSLTEEIDQEKQRQLGLIISCVVDNLQHCYHAESSFILREKIIQTYLAFKLVEIIQSCLIWNSDSCSLPCVFVHTFLFKLQSKLLS